MRKGRGVPAPDVDDSEPITFRYEVGEDESPSHALVRVISTIAGTSATGFGPLGRHVDLEAIDDLVASAEDDGPISASLTLSVDGLSVDVDGSEIVWTLRGDAADRSRGEPGWSPNER